MPPLAFYSVPARDGAVGVGHSFRGLDISLNVRLGAQAEVTGLVELRPLLGVKQTFLF